jgi:hypothetical protein
MTQASHCAAGGRTAVWRELTSVCLGGPMSVLQSFRALARYHVLTPVAVRLGKGMLIAALFSATTLPASAASLIVQPVPPVMYASELPSDLYFSFEAIAMGRSGTNTVLGQDNSTGPFLNFSTRDLAAIGFGGGAKFIVGGKLQDGWGFEMGGLVAGGFSSSGQRISVGGQLFGAYSTAVTNANLVFNNAENAYAVTFTESSSLASFEASATYGTDGFGVFFGPKLISYKSSLGTAYFDDLNDFAGTDDQVDRINISSSNTLIGAQLGVVGMYDINEMFSVGGRAAVGLYANNAVLDRTYRAGVNQFPFTTASQSSSASSTAFAQSVEISPKVDIALTSSLDFTLGATWLYLNGVDEPGKHYVGMGVNNGANTLAADAPTFSNGVNFAGVSAGLHGKF